MHRRPLPLLLFVFLLIGSRSLFADEKSGETSPREYGKPKQLGILTDEAIDESSGIAASRSVPGAYWTHNDSGDSPRIFLISKTGKTLATFQVDGAQAEDWEDICSFVHDSKNYLLIGDVGDNQRRRNEVKLYLVEEPTLEKNAEGVKGSVPVAMTLRVKYEDGPRDCESIAVDPASMKIYLVAKQFSTKCPIYEIPLPEKSPPDPVVAKACGTLPVSIATAMDISLTDVE